MRVLDYDDDDDKSNTRRPTSDPLINSPFQLCCAEDGFNFGESVGRMCASRSVGVQEEVDVFVGLGHEPQPI